MKITTSSSKKALLLILAMATISIGKVFAQTQTAHSSILRSDVHYSSSSVLAKDIKAGKLKLSGNVTELFWINRQLDRWNAALVENQVLKIGDTEYFQLRSRFTNLQDARDYIADILSNHCKDFDATFKKGECKIGRAELGRTNAITVDFERDARDGERLTMLVPSSFTEVSKSDGDLPLIDSFSLYCLNDVEMVKAKKPAPKQPVEEKKVTSSLVSIGYEVTYNPIVDKGTFATTTAGNNTYNTYNTVNTPPPPPVDKHPNRGIFISAGVGLVTTVVAFLLNRRMQQSYPQPVGYSPQVYTYQAPNNPVITNPAPIQGNTGNVYNPPPIQGNTGSNVWYDPIQGSSNGVVGYNPIQGGTTLQQYYDPVQGLIWK